MSVIHRHTDFHTNKIQIRLSINSNPFYPKRPSFVQQEGLVNLTDVTFPKNAVDILALGTKVSFLLKQH